MKKILIFGMNLQAATLYQLITQEHQGEVVAFLIDPKYKKADYFQNLPVITSEEVLQNYPTSDYKICLSFGYKNMVHNREQKFEWCKERGYEIYSFISQKANVYTDQIGEGCNIYPGTTIMPFATIGIGTYIEAGCTIAHHTKIGNFNFIAPGVHFCGDITTGNNCFFGGAAEIINGIEIGPDVFVEAGAKAYKNVSSGATIKAPMSRIQNDSAYESMQKMFNI